MNSAELTAVGAQHVNHPPWSANDDLCSTLQLRNLEPATAEKLRKTSTKSPSDKYNQHLTKAEINTYQSQKYQRMQLKFDFQYR